LIGLADSPSPRSPTVSSPLARSRTYLRDQ
jgi:hypothetical protein